MILQCVLLYDCELTIGLYLHDFMRPHTSGEGGVGTSDGHEESSHDHMTPPTSHVQFFSTKKMETHSAKPLGPYVSATANG